VFARWGLPLIFCARTTLGTINHSLLSLAAIKARGIALTGVVFIGDYDEDNEATVCEMGGARRLGRLPLLDPLNAESLRAAFARNFDLAEFG
jgi:dethiobiotin synthetase